MITKSDYKSKFEYLSPFIEEFCRGIKKEIKQEFVHKGAFRKSESSFEWKEISEFLYKKVAEEGDEKTGEWLASTWLLKNGEIFQYFHEELSLVDESYDKLTSLPAAVEKKIKEESARQFGFLPTCLFCVLNSVVFSQEIFDELKQGALEEMSMGKNVLEEDRNISSIEDLKKSFEQEKRKLEEKYEKRIQGVMKKYQIEVEGYRKQIGQLQKKLESVNVCSG